MSSAETFYETTPVFRDFDRVLDPGLYRPLPGGWWIGLTDVVDSTAAIAGGRYKAVNMAGAAAISAVMNVVGRADFPFVFGGDGASFAVPPARQQAARDALARTVRWVREDLGLTLRAALVPLTAVRTAGKDVRVARFAPSAHVTYAMFSGRGLAWAEGEMKRDRFCVAPAPEGARPDLAGLSCRWTPIESRQGVILSLLVAPLRAADDPDFVAVARRVIALLGSHERDGHPVPAEGPGFSWPPQGLDLEARAQRRVRGSLTASRLRILLESLLARVLDRRGWTLGRFDPKVYRRETALNTDFRKFDDLLRMTVDCDGQVLGEIKRLLAEAAERDVLRYGLWEQKAALMTCIVPSALAQDHMHFLDGAEGGYARAALALKAGSKAQATTVPPVTSG